MTQTRKVKIGVVEKNRNPLLSLATIRKWHWMSSAICFMCMLLFSVTGITLNHAGSIEASPTTVHLEGVVPASILSAIVLSEKQKTVELPASLSNWFREIQRIKISRNLAEVNDTELYLALPKPGGDAWLSLNVKTGQFEYESTSRGWISYFNDLHKGRNTGMAWIYFMDMFALACLLFSVTGFLLLQRYAATRSQTYPLLITGAVVPVVLMIFLVHS